MMSAAQVWNSRDLCASMCQACNFGAQVVVIATLQCEECQEQWRQR
jgi:hypothetical protein